MIPVLFRIGPFAVYSFGLMAALAFLAGRWILLRGLERRGIPAAQGEAHTWAALVGGILGAHLYFLIEHWHEVRHDPLGTIVSGAGLVWWGGVAGGALGVLIVLRIKRHPIGLVADAFAPALTMVYAIGRIGCLLSGDGDYGTPTDLPWAMSFPNGVVPTTQRVHPTPLYETLLMLGIFYLLRRLERRALPAGALFWAYLGLASLERLLAGFTRGLRDVALGLDMVQLISVAGMILAVAGSLYLRRRSGVG